MTLVELLVALVILGMMTGIGALSVMSLRPAALGVALDSMTSARRRAIRGWPPRGSPRRLAGAAVPARWPCSGRTGGSSHRSSPRCQLALCFPQARRLGPSFPRSVVPSFRRSFVPPAPPSSRSSPRSRSSGPPGCPSSRWSTSRCAARPSRRGRNACWTRPTGC
ncbi:MAG: type II secretion system protein [Gemmatimonadetes bacterium]|nr:type II secretion system protein [Gemmatimonadota bacterium]